jgi:hypothetical protein
MNEERILAKVLERASKPFDPEEVEFSVKAASRDRKRALMVAHLTARSVMDRLDDMVREGLLESWTSTFEVVERSAAKVQTRDGGKEESRYAVVARIHLELPGGKVLVKEDVGEGDTLKGAFSDALKRAAVHLGIGRYLYRLGEMWVDLPEGRDYPSEEEIRRLRAKLRSLTRQEAREERSQAQARPQGQPRVQGGPQGQGEDEAGKVKELQERAHKADKVLTELIANLKAKGLGTEAARLVADAGYKIGEDLEGKTVEDLEAMVEKARELYTALRDLAERK